MNVNNNLIRIFLIAFIITLIISFFIGVFYNGNNKITISSLLILVTIFIVVYFKKD